MGSYFNIVVAHTLKNDRTKILNDYFSANEIFEENHLIFFSINGSLLAYLQCIYITSCFPSKILMLSKQCARVS